MVQDRFELSVYLYRVFYQLNYYNYIIHPPVPWGVDREGGGLYFILFLLFSLGGERIL